MMRNVLRGAAAVLSILAGSALVGNGNAQNLSITNFQVVSQIIITPTQSRVTYKADLVNGGTSFASVMATATTLNPFQVRIVPGQDTLTFAPVPANSQTTSVNTFTVLVNPNLPFNSSSLSFTYQAVAGPLNANAGPDQTVQVGSTVTLNGSGSTSPGGPLTYSWVFVSMPVTSATVLVNPSNVMPTFLVDVPGTYIVQLTIGSGGATSAATVRISTGNTAPVANGGPNQTVLLGSTVTLDGSGSTDTNGDPLTYAWFIYSKPGASQATLTGASTVKPTFVADVSGNYVIQLLVNDGISNSKYATVTISTTTSVPVANAGSNQLLSPGSLVQLDGSASSDQDGNLLTYLWTFNTMPTGSTAMFSDPTAVKPTFTADLGGIYVVQLVVSDNGLKSTPVTVTISSQGPLQPTANAGPNQSVKHGTTVTLSGSGTDPQSLPLTYLWSFVSKPAGSTAVLTSTTIQNPKFLADQPGNYVVQLIVNDGTMSSFPATTMISTTNTAPVASAGTNANVPIGATVVLSGAGSTDADGDPLTYAWSFMSIPAGSTAKLTAATSIAPMFVADLAGTYVIQLIVNDGFVNSSTSSVTITAATAAITLSPNPLMLTTGPATLAVMLSAPAFPANGQVVNLISSNPGAATVPSSVTVPHGATGANVTVTPGGVTGSTTITASASGFTSGTDLVTSSVSQIILPVGLTLGPNVTTNFQVTLATPSVGGTFVSLSTSDPSVATVSPTFFYIPDGSVNPYRPPQITGVGFGTCTITASSNGLTSTSQLVSVVGGSGLSPSTIAVTTGSKAVLTLILNSPAPSGGLTVNVSSDNTAIATVPATVFIAANTTSASIQVTGVAVGSTVIHANSLPNLPDVTASVTVVGVAQVVIPSYLIIGQWGFSGPMPVNLSAPAPAGGVTLTLSSSETNMVTVTPATIFIPQGGTTPASLPILTGNDIGYSTITVTAPGYLAGSVQVHVTDQITIGLQDGVIVRVGQSVPYIVALPGAAPAGGVTVSLVSLDPTKLTVPASVFIPAGALIAPVPIQVTGVGVGTVTIRGSSPAYSTEVQSVQVQANQ